ncbi:pilus assembly protein TadG-related protein [Luteipulveratus sp. YIM 133132]|uniref:Rv3654c family TadE-like protein n=1 Tax=Luteipulveratus flavus TaxID=3031728 RepID=UPI0023AF0EAA|nr:Rv3654c family TadE-like protein [Luteipulveratus sp. YIM 133132]MDE9366946.1 pilus assembly protein TadG-related protein [Luteipulveratus sp. YIM 133132]
MRSRRADLGSGTVVMVGVCGVLLLVLMGGLALVSAAHASTRARTAADLAALAAADRVLNPVPGVAPCAAAGRLAVTNGGVLLECTASSTDAVVLVSVPASVPGLGDATARSRAGLAEPGR